MAVLNAGQRLVGARLRRVEDPRLLAGQGAFVDDLAPPNLLHLVVVRSLHAHAELRSVDVSAARAQPGVAAAFAGDELAHQLGTLAVTGRLPGQRLLESHILVTDRVRHVGEPIAVVVAESRYAAEDAAELVRVEYDPLPPVLSVEDALAPDAPLLYADWPHNVAAELRLGSGDVAAAFARADHVFRETYRIHRHTGSALETRGTLAQFDSLTGDLTVWTSTQSPHPVRDALAAALDWPAHRLRVIAADTGGGFGQKDQAYPEDVLTAWLAIHLRRPVKWIEDRREHFLATAHGREQVHHVELAVRADGTLLAVREHLLADMGAHLHKVGIGPALIAAQMLPGPYRLDAYAAHVQGVVTNKTASAAYRGFGQPQAVFVMERLVDTAARALGRDPADLRRQNMWRPDELPCTSPSGQPYDSGDYPAALDQALAAIDYAGVRAEQAARRAGGAVDGQERLLGVGLAAYVQATGLGPSRLLGQGGAPAAGYESARLVMDRQGRVTAYSGVSSHGQGLATSLAQLVADSLGLPFADVTVVMGDTARCPYSPLGTAGSRSATVGGAALLRAADQVRDKLARLAAQRLEAAPTDIVLADSRASVRGAPDRGVTVAALAEALHLARELPPDLAPGIEAHAVYDPPAMEYANAVHAVVVEVERATGVVGVRRYAVVNDCGVILNPTIVEGQIHGGVVQGLGGALLEELVYDGGGQLLTASLMDYLLPTAVEAPPIEISHLESPSPFTPGGIKGMGEGGSIGAYAALANAVADALAPLGRPITTLPLRPDYLMSASTPAAT